MPLRAHYKRIARHRWTITIATKKGPFVPPCTRKIVILGGVLVFCASCAAVHAEPSNSRPYAYLFPAELHALAEHVQRAGVQVDELREDIELEVEIHHIQQIVDQQRPNVKKPVTHLKTEVRQETRRFVAGTILVKTKQDLGDRIVRLLDPRTNKSPRARRLLPQLQEGKEYPIVKLNSYVPITHGPVRPLPEKLKADKPITFETVYGPEHKVDFGGSPVSGLTWLDDGEHYLQVRDGKLYKVQATSGQSALFVDPNKLAEGLKRLPAMRKSDAESLSKTTTFEMSPDRTAVLLDYENDLYYATIDGTTAVRLTSSPGREKYATFDPAGRLRGLCARQQPVRGGCRDANRKSPDHRRRRHDP